LEEEEQLEEEKEDDSSDDDEKKPRKVDDASEATPASRADGKNRPKTIRRTLAKRQEAVKKIVHGKLMKLQLKEIKTQQQQQQKDTEALTRKHNGDREALSSKFQAKITTTTKNQQTRDVSLQKKFKLDRENLVMKKHKLDKENLVKKHVSDQKQFKTDNVLHQKNQIKTAKIPQRDKIKEREVAMKQEEKEKANINKKGIEIIAKTTSG